MSGRRWVVAGFAVVALLAAGCTGRPTPAGPAPTPTPAPGSQPPGAAAGGQGPRVIIVVEENHSFAQVIGSPQAPGLNQLARRGVLLTEFYATTHPSLPNYIALLSGDTHGITSDCGKCTVDAPNLVDRLEQANVSWKAYMQGLPEPCATVTRAGAYAKKHNPFMYFDSIRDDPARCAKVVPFSQFQADLDGGQLPRFVFVTPDLDHDMHGAGEGGDDAQLVATADAWLQDLYGRLTASAAWRQDTRLVVTWDEGGGGSRGKRGCCDGLANGGNVATVIAGPKVRPGRDATPYDHYALLRSVQTLLHLQPYLGHAADPSSKDIPALASQAAG